MGYGCSYYAKGCNIDHISSRVLVRRLYSEYLSDVLKLLPASEGKSGGGGHCIRDCTPTRDRGQSEDKRSRRNFEAGQAVKLGVGGGGGG